MRNVASGDLRGEKARGFGQLRAARERVGSTNEESAGKAGVSRSAVAVAATGACLPQPRKWTKLTDALDADLEELWR